MRGFCAEVWNLELGPSPLRRLRVWKFFISANDQLKFQHHRKLDHFISRRHFCTVSHVAKCNVLARYIYHLSQTEHYCATRKTRSVTYLICRTQHRNMKFYVVQRKAPNILELIHVVNSTWWDLWTLLTIACNEWTKNKIHDPTLYWSQGSVHCHTTWKITTENCYGCHGEYVLGKILHKTWCSEWVLVDSVIWAQL